MISTPSSVGSIPSRRSVSISSGCATMPAPRPDELALDPLEDLDVPAVPPQQQRRPAGRSSSRRSPGRARSSAYPRGSIPWFPTDRSCYISCRTLEECHGYDDDWTRPRTGPSGPPGRRRSPPSSSGKRRTPIRAWATELVSESDRVRVWMIRLKPGERIGFHRHVLDYFWTSVSGGRGRQHVHDGTTVEYTYAPGETRHEHLRRRRVQGPRPRKSRRQGHGVHDHRVPAERQQADGAARDGASPGRGITRHLPLVVLPGLIGNPSAWRRLLSRGRGWMRGSSPRMTISADRLSVKSGRRDADGRRPAERTVGSRPD